MFKCVGFCVTSLAVLLSSVAFATQPGWYIAFDGGQARYGGIARDSLHWISMPPGPAPGWATDTLSAIVTRRGSDSGAYRLTVGYQFSPYLGVEVGYADTGNIQAAGSGNYAWSCNPPPGDECVLVVGGGPYTSTAKLSTRGWVLAGTASWPISPRWSLFARVGAFDAHTVFDASSTPSTADPQVVPASTHYSSTNWKPTYGVGVSFSPADHWALRLGWGRYANVGDRTTTGKFSVNLVSLGIAYTL